MKVICLQASPHKYSCNAYLILGSWNRIEDVNTLVDIGSDGYILLEVATINTGVGKSPVEKAIMTHSHFDHTAGVGALKKKYQPQILAAGKVAGVDKIIKDGQMLHCGDEIFEVIGTPGHSQDSICLYNRTSRILFSGDTLVQVRNVGGSYTNDYLEALKKLTRLDIDRIYPGHGQVIEDATEILGLTLYNVKRSMAIQ